MGFKRVFAVFMSAVLAFSLTPAASLTAFADDLAAGTVDLAPHTAAATTTQEGECNWTFDSTTGALTISPTIPGTTAKLTVPDYYLGYYPSYKDEVKKLVFDGLLSISDFDSVIGDHDGFFAEFGNLKTINVTPGSSVKASGSLRYIFSGCKSLTDISGLSAWDTSDAIDMVGILKGTSIKDVSALAKWNTSKVIDMDDMFSGCSKLVDISGLSRWNISRVTRLCGMFYGCKSLKNLSGLFRWDTSRVRNMQGMFSGCTALTDLSGLAKWDTCKVQSYGMEFMFRDCPVTKVSWGPKWRYPSNRYGDGGRIGIGEMGLAWFDLKWTSRNAKKKGPLSMTSLTFGWKPSTMAGTWRVQRLPITKAAIRVPNVVYRGKAACPEPRVKMKSTYGSALTLKKGRDYTVSYRNNKKVGKATVIITGKGWFKGTKKVTFRITEASSKNTSKATQNKKALAAYKKLLSKRSIRWGNAYSSVNLPTSNLKFAVQDINKDGVSELVLSSKDAAHAVGYKRIYTYANGKLRSLGNFTDVSVYRNKSYFRHTSGGMGDFTEVYYRLGKDGKKTTLARREVTVNDGAMFGYNGLGFKTGKWSGYGKAWFYNYKVGSKSVSATEGQAYISKLTKGAKQTLSFRANTAKNRARYLKAK